MDGQRKQTNTIFYIIYRNLKVNDVETIKVFNIAFCEMRKH